MLAHRLCQRQENCPIRIMFIASNPLKVRRAVVNELNPIPGFVNRADVAVRKAPLGCSNMVLLKSQLVLTLSHYLHKASSVS